MDLFILFIYGFNKVMKNNGFIFIVYFVKCYCIFCYYLLVIRLNKNDINFIVFNKILFE